MELPFGLVVCGVDEILDGAAAKATHACSILDPGAGRPPALARLGQGRLIELRFNDVVDDETACPGPQARDVARLLEFGGSIAFSDGERPRLLVHCHLGLSRSTAAAMLLVAKASPGLAAEEVIAAVCSARPEAWPNLRLVGLGDAAPRRGGTLAAATQALLRRQSERLPHLAALMQRDGLGREVLRDGTVRRLAIAGR